MKRVLSFFVAALILLSLCACNQSDNTNNPDNSFQGDIPEVIFGTWHPHPEVSNIPIEINSDGTCDLDGQNLSWEVESATDDEVILTTGTHYLTFSQLTSPLPLLSTSFCGDAVKNPVLWNYMIEWHDPDTGSGFVLDMVELAQADVNIQFEDDQMMLEVLDGEFVTHFIEVTASHTVVVDIYGNSTTFYPMGGNSNGGNSDDPEARYVQAVEDLQNVLAGGSMTDYRDGADSGNTLSGAAAIEQLYKTFLCLQDYVDVSDQLSCIRKVDNMPVSVEQTMDGNTYPFADYTYDCFGSKAQTSVVEAITTKQQIYKHYGKNGSVRALTVWGLVYGYPIYDEHGYLTALDVPSADTSKRYTSPVTFDSNGNIVRIEIPFTLNEGPETGCNQVYEFLYDTNGRLIQYTSTKYSTGGTYESTSFYKTNGFYEKVITQCRYDTAGRLIATVEHQDYVNASGQGSWSFTPTEFVYNADGLLTTRIITYSVIHYSGFSKEEKKELDSIHDSLFHHSSLVDSIAQALFEKIDGRLQFKELVRYEYEYGSIYIYAPNS